MEQPPDTIERFQILRRQSGAGDGDVYLAHDPRSGRTVSLRVIVMRDPSWLNVLRDQLPRLVSISHPSIAPVREFTLGDTSAVIAYEYSRDETLADLIARQADLPIPVKLRIVSELCRSIAAALQQGITILDMSPAGLWISGSGASVRLGGVELPGDRAARAAGPDPRAAAYLSPEQIQRADADGEASAVFRAGLVLYELIANRRPFEGADAAETARNILLSEPPPLPGIQHQEILEGIVRRALAKSPADRYVSLEAMAAELSRLAEAALPVTVAPGDEGVIQTPRAPKRDPEVAVLPEAAPAAALETPLVYDQNVQFTVFQPRNLAPAVWQTMLVFAHLAEARADAAPDEPDPVEEVQRQAQAILGDLKASGRQTVDSLQAVPRDGELTFVPRAEGVEFNPPSRQFKWTESVHREEFRLRAGPDRAGSVARGRLSVFLGCILLAEIPLALRIGTAGKPATEEVVRQSARPYRRIFASYSHLDKPIVQEFADYAKAMGDRYQLDVIDLRSGEQWAPALQALIREADVFQLFWSWNALRSPYVRDEWQYALGLQRASFVRPVYWEDPIPKDGDLPPAALLDLHFEPIRPRGLPKAAVRRSDAHRTPTPMAPAPVPAPPAAWADPDESTAPTMLSVPAAAAKPVPATPPTKKDASPAKPVSAPPARPVPPARPPVASYPDTIQSRPGTSAPAAARGRVLSWRIAAPVAAALLLLAIVPTIMLRQGANPSQKPPVVTSPPKTESVIVEVTDVGGQSVNGAVVMLESGAASFNGVTDASGRATLELPISSTPHEYAVTVEAAGRTRKTRTVVKSEEAIVRIQLPRSP